MSEVHKINTISQAEYKINRLYENIDRVEGNLSSRIASVREQATRDAEKRARDLIEKERSRMKEALDKEISDVNSSIKELDKEQRRRLKETAKNLEEMIDTQADSIRRETRRNISDLKGEIGKLASDTRKRLNEQSRRMDKLAEASKKRYDTLQSRISQLSKETLKRFDEQQRQLDSHGRQLDSHEKQINNLRTTVNSILDHFKNEDQKRREAVDMAVAIYKAAFKRTPIDRFNPEEAAKVHDRMKWILSNANDSAAKGQAIDAIMEIQWAEEKALKAKIIYDAVLNEALESLDTVLAEVNSNREIEVADPNCEGEVVSIETDFWNRGKYTEIIKNLEALKAELKAQPDLERIEKITKEIARCEVEATEMVSKAGQQAVLSENRVVITEDIVTALLAQGWQIEQTSAGEDDFGYEGGEVDHDWREGVYAYLRSMNGERIVIRVIPTEDSIANEIAFHRVDNRSITAAEFMRSLHNLKNQIEKSGHKLGDFQVPAVDGGNSKLTEVSSSSQLGKKGASQSIRRKTRGK